MTEAAATKTTTAVPSPFDYCRFGERLGHHGTVPRDAQPGEPFVQLLKIRSRNGHAVAEPSVIVWQVDADGTITAIGYRSEDIRSAREVLDCCKSLSPAYFRRYLQNAADLTRAGWYWSPVKSLDELIDR